MSTKPPASTRSGLIRQYWRPVLIAVLVCAGVAVLSRFVTLAEVRAYADRIHPAFAFALLVVLPLVGFPVSVLHAAAGLRFGVGLGFVFVALSIVLQLLASYGLVRLFGRWFDRRLAGLKARVPRTAHGTMCLFTLLLPGVPYFAKNYVLPLLGVPLRTYLLWCGPSHIARSLVGIVVGDISSHLTPARVAGLALYATVVLLASWWAWRRLRAQFGDRPATAGDRKRRA